jgi:hypothetical protein
MTRSSCVVKLPATAPLRPVCPPCHALHTPSLVLTACPLSSQLLLEKGVEDTGPNSKALPSEKVVSSTAQHSTAQHSTAQHSTAQHSTAQHSTAQHSTAQHSMGVVAMPSSPSYTCLAASDLVRTSSRRSRSSRSVRQHCRPSSQCSQSACRGTAATWCSHLCSKPVSPRPLASAVSLWGTAAGPTSLHLRTGTGTDSDAAWEPLMHCTATAHGCHHVAPLHMPYPPAPPPSTSTSPHLPTWPTLHTHPHPTPPLQVHEYLRSHVDGMGSQQLQPFFGAVKVSSCCAAVLLCCCAAVLLCCCAGPKSAALGWLVVRGTKFLSSLQGVQTHGALVAHTELHRWKPSRMHLVKRRPCASIQQLA